MTERRLKVYCEKQFNQCSEGHDSVEKFINRCYGAVQFYIEAFPSEKKEIEKWYKKEVLSKFIELEYRADFADDIKERRDIKMKQGMLLMKSACCENIFFDEKECRGCPFGKLCDYALDLKTPDDIDFCPGDWFGWKNE